MNARPFAKFLKEGTVRKQRPDPSRAASLSQEAAARYAFLNEAIRALGVTDHNANYVVELAYDVVMECVRSKLAEAGYKSSGLSAHEAEVAYLQELRFSSDDVLFANELRHWRNGILYYGTRVDARYAKKVLAFLKRAYPRLR